MERISISVDSELATAFDAFLRRRGYGNRSEAVRDLIRRALEEERLEEADPPHCVASLTYVYNHHERELASRLTGSQHEHHDLAHATLHVHLDHDHCLETVILRGATQEVREFADGVCAQRGVRHGRLHLVPVQESSTPHRHHHARPLT